MMNLKNTCRYLACVSILFISGITENVKAISYVVEVEWEGRLTDFKLFSVQTENHLTEYYYADILVEDEGKTVVRVYWDIWGEYLKIGLKDDQHLTKINREIFSLKEMEKLHLLLNNKNADIKHYKMSHLTSKEAETAYYSVDAVSGATVVESSYECVDGGVKVCYNLWHRVHGEVVEAIKKATLKEIENGAHVTLNSYDDLSFLTEKILQQQKLTAVEINQIRDLSNQSFIWYSSLIYEIKQSAIYDRDFNTKLNSLLIETTSEVTQLLIFNFLTDRGFRSKEVRQFTPDFKVL